MARMDPVVEFVREALTAGRTRAEISEALENAGWSGKEIGPALANYAETDFQPPVPRPRPHVTARDAFIYLLLFTALGVAAGHLISLLWSILTLQMPDATDSTYRARYADTSIRWAISALVVAGPMYLWLTILTRRQITNEEGQNRSLVRKWLTYLAMFIAAMFFLGDAMYVVYSFLDGEMTLRLALKALVLAVVCGAIFLFYLDDVSEGKADG